MFVYLVRHGEAKTEEEDPERGLSAKGFREATSTGAYVRDRGIKPCIIYHSGKKRAAQTAQIISDILKMQKGMVETKSLAPMEDPRIWVQRLSGANEDVMLVGHLPHLANLAGHLLGGGTKDDVADFKTGGIMCLKRLGDDHWVLDWSISPGFS